jgi:hypothetical protein
VVIHPTSEVSARREPWPAVENLQNGMRRIRPRNDCGMAAVIQGLIRTSQVFVATQGIAMASTSRKSNKTVSPPPPRAIAPLVAEVGKQDDATAEITNASGLEQVSQSAYRAQIEEAAYYRAERRGFSPGYEEQDWLEAEREIREQQSNQGENFPS